MRQADVLDPLVSSFFLYRVEWLLIRDPSSHKLVLLPEAPGRGANSCESLHQSCVTVKSVFEAYASRFNPSGASFQRVLDPVAFFHSAIGGLFPVYLLYYKNRKIFQGVAL